MWYNHTISQENKRKRGKGGRYVKFEKGGEVTNIWGEEGGRGGLHKIGG